MGLTKLGQLALDFTDVGPDTRLRERDAARAPRGRVPGDVSATAPADVGQGNRSISSARDVGGYEREEIEREASRRGLATVQLLQLPTRPGRAGRRGGSLLDLPLLQGSESVALVPTTPARRTRFASFANRRPHGPRFWVG